MNRRLRGIGLTAWAFLRVGALDTLAYPLSFVLSNIGHLTNVFLYYFIARIIDPGGGLVGSDYFTYAVLGVLVVRVLGAGLEEFGSMVQRTIDQGQLELYLVQPVGWRVLPFAWFQWLLCYRVLGGIVTMLVALALGGRYRADQLPLAFVVLALGVCATHAIGVIAGSIRILAKRSDPVLMLYGIATTVFAGLFVPVQVMPRPLQWLSWLTPHAYTVDALRQLMLLDPGNSSRISVGNAIIALVIFTIVAYTLGLWLFTRCLNFARRNGLLGAY
jgi:ABC-2 type transport system permease protein